jgi:ribosome-binding protein aMBF1 (putative translation factor)
MECPECGDDVEKLTKVKIGKQSRKVCEDCADRLREEAEVAGEAESAMQSMMEYKGRR